MTGRVDARTLKEWLSDGAEIAFLDVREHGQYGEGHPFFAVSLPYSRFELGLPVLVPNAAARLVLCDGADGVAERAAKRAEALGYRSVHILESGVEAWRDAGYTLYAGVNVPSKTFGELVEHARETPRVTAEALAAMREAGEDMVILDGRTFAEFQKMSIPGGISCPNGELALHVGALVPDPRTRIVVNCAGRTRSIIGAQTLIDFGVPNPVYALENGTQGWFLAGLQLDHGARRRAGEAPPPADIGALRERARALAAARGVAFVGGGEVAGWLADPSRTTYLLDVRTPEEFAASAVPGFVHAPGGQLVQATDQWIGVRGARVVLVDDEEVRAPMTAQWLRQLGHEACVLEGGIAEARQVVPAVMPEAETQPRLQRDRRSNLGEERATASPPPLWGRDRVGGDPEHQGSGFPPPLTPPHKGEGNSVAAVAGEPFHALRVGTAGGQASGTSGNVGDPGPMAPCELANLLRNGGVRLIDLRSSMSYRKEHIDGAVWSIRPRIAAVAPEPGQFVVLVADEPGVAALAALDLAEAGVGDVRLLAGGHEAARTAGLPIVATPERPGDAECIDFLSFTHGRHEGNAEAARQYLAWEIALVDQLDAQERASFAVSGPV